MARRMGGCTPNVLANGQTCGPLPRQKNYFTTRAVLDQLLDRSGRLSKANFYHNAGDSKATDGVGMLRLNGDLHGRGDCQIQVALEC